MTTSKEPAVIDALVQRAGVEPVMFAFQWIDGSWNNASHTEHSSGMKSLYPPEAIAQLQARIEALSAEVGRLTKERDAWKGNHQELSHLCQNTIFERDQLRIKLEGEAVAVKLWCETCEGKGTVDNTLGGNNPNSTDHDPCPDCDGSGGFVSSVYRTHPAPAPVEAQGEAVAFVKFKDGEVNYGTDDNIVISNTPGDCMDESIEWLPVFTHPAPAAPVVEPLPLLVRDIAADLGTTPIQVCEALRLMGLGGYSVNMAVTPEMSRRLTEYFAALHPTQPKGEKA